MAADRLAGESNMSWRDVTPSTDVAPAADLRLPGAIETDSQLAADEVQLAAQPSWLARAFRAVGRSLATGLTVLVVLLVLIVLCAELGWFIGWSGGEVAKLIATHNVSPVTFARDFAHALGDQRSVPVALLNILGQIRRFLPGGS